LVDHLGLLIGGVISAANCGERDGLDVLLYFHQQGHLPKKIFADQGYTGEEIRLEVKKYGIELETVKRREKKGFVLEARRWIVERTFAWLGKFRRLSKDYELITATSMSMIYLAMSRLMVKRIACPA
jgi:putative transposase